MVMWTGGAVALGAEVPLGGEAGGWRCAAPRAEIAPRFEWNAMRREWRIRADDCESRSGWWWRQMAVTGGQCYAFRVRALPRNVTNTLRSVVARLIWQAADGQRARLDPPLYTPRVVTDRPASEPEHPVEADRSPDGWLELRGVYATPSNAAAAVVELHLRWAPGGEVAWRDAELTPVPPLPPRIVRVAAVHCGPWPGATSRTSLRSSRR